MTCQIDTFFIKLINSPFCRRMMYSLSIACKGFHIHEMLFGHSQNTCLHPQLFISPYNFHCSSSIYRNNVLIYVCHSSIHFHTNFSRSSRVWLIVDFISPFEKLPPSLRNHLTAYDVFTIHKYQLFVNITAHTSHLDVWSNGTFILVMLKYRKNLVSIVSTPVSILVPYNITVKEISVKLKKFFERNVQNILKTWTTNFWNTADLAYLGHRLSGTTVLLGRISEVPI